MYDWNGNGHVDSGDSYMDYNLTHEGTKATGSNENNTSSESQECENDKDHQNNERQRTDESSENKEGTKKETKISMGSIFVCFILGFVIETFLFVGLGMDVAKINDLVLFFIWIGISYLCIRVHRFFSS